MREKGFQPDIFEEAKPKRIGWRFPMRKPQLQFYVSIFLKAGKHRAFNKIARLDRESSWLETLFEDSPHHLDIALGSRVRLRRKELGMSQSDLAKACSITFQQVQKYEYGTNRISFSRLVEMSEALECSVGDLIGNLDTSKSSGAFSKNVSNLVETGATELMKAYAGIGSPQQRRAVVNLACQLAREQAQEAPKKRSKAKRARA